MEERLVTISFGLLENGNKEVKPCSCWEIHDGEMGIFIIQSSDMLPLSSTLSLSSDGNILWDSPIRTVPEGALSLPFTGEDAYTFISSRVLRPSDIPSGDNALEVLLKEEGKEITAGLLMIEYERDIAPETTYADSLSQKPVSIETVNIPRDEDDEGILFDGPITVEVPEEAFPMRDTDDYADYIPDDEKVSISDNIPEPEEIDHGEFMEPGETDNVENAEDQEFFDLKTELFRNLSGYTPLHLNLDIVEAPRQYDSLKKNIVIERIGNCYITVLNDFLSRPVYFMYNGEQIIEWNNSFEEYLSWMKNLVGKMYNISEEELSEMEKLVITEDNIDQKECIGENILWMSRRDSLENLVYKTPVILDLTMEACTFSFLDHKEGKRLFISCEGLALKSFMAQEEVTSMEEAASSWINCALDVLAPISDIPVLFTGLSAFPVIYDNLKSRFTTARDLPFVSLSWEI